MHAAATVHVQKQKEKKRKVEYIPVVMFRAGDLALVALIVLTYTDRP